MAAAATFSLNLLALLSPFIPKGARSKHSTIHTLPSLEELSNKTLFFHLETTLLQSTSLFPYFMLVAFEAGGLIRALILFLLYPLIWLSSRNIGLKIMVFVSFVGLRKDKFRIGSSVMPKFFLEDVGDEGFSLVMSGKRKVAVSDMPSVMIECFVKDYMGVDAVFGRELKVVFGHFVGLMEPTFALDDVVMVSSSHTVAIGPGFSRCKVSIIFPGFIILY